MRASDDRTRIDAVLRHLGCGQDFRDFPGTASEKLALIRTAASRGLIAWQRGRGRYELTSVGWSELTPRRRFTLASMMVSTAVGAAVGAATLAFLWLPADASHRSGRQASAPVSRPADANGDVRTPAPPPRTAPAAPTEPAKVADQPVPEQPSAEAAPTEVKQATVKKTRRKTASRRRKDETDAAWAYAEPSRARPPTYSGYGGQGYGFFR
jgi:hypothetical protein